MEAFYSICEARSLTLQAICDLWSPGAPVILGQFGTIYSCHYIKNMATWAIDLTKDILKGKCDTNFPFRVSILEKDGVYFMCIWGRNEQQSHLQKYSILQQPYIFANDIIVH